MFELKLLLLIRNIIMIKDISIIMPRGNSHWNTIHWIFSIYIYILSKNHEIDPSIAYLLQKLIFGSKSKRNTDKDWLIDQDR